MRMEIAQSLSDVESSPTPSSEAEPQQQAQQVLNFPLVDVANEPPSARDKGSIFRSKRRTGRRKPDRWEQAAIDGGHVYPKP
jgi:hypothetical protein